VPHPQPRGTDMDDESCQDRGPVRRLPG
jgi:hypothetical protein